MAKRIRHPPSLMAKLGVKPGLSVAALGMPRPLVEALREAAGAVATRAGSGRDRVFLFAAGPAALAKIRAAKAALAPAGGLWLVRSKVDGRVTEADVLTAGRGAGLTDVKVARIDEGLSALKFVVL